MGKRKQPFGYKMEFGDIVPEPEEAEAVRSIYLRYLAGASFKALAEALQEQGLPYDGDKPWNKNMVARILEDQRYTGTDRFPSLITEEQFLAAQERRKQMTPERTQTPAQKELRKLCGGAPPQYVERQVLGILNRLIHDPQLINASIPNIAESPIFQRQRRELDTLLRSPPVDEEQAKSSALALASFMLTSIGPEEYETCRLQRLFQSRQPMQLLEYVLNELNIYAQQEKLTFKEFTQVYGRRTVFSRLDGKWYISNPANPEDNLADKWNQDGRIPMYFFRWVNAVRADLIESLQQENEQQFRTAIENGLGSMSVSSVLGKKYCSTTTPKPIVLQGAAKPYLSL